MLIDHSNNPLFQAVIDYHLLRQKKINEKLSYEIRFSKIQ